MSKNNEKTQLVNKLVRWIFVFIIVMSLLQIPLFLTMGDNAYSFDLDENITLFLIGASVVGIVLVAIVLFAIWPIVSQLLAIRKAEKEDPDLFL